jgi:hypothetical protein
MTELLHEAFSIHNLPVTVLLGLVLCYWLLVVVGVMDADEGGVDFNGDGHADFGDHSAEGGFWLIAGKFLHLGYVPLMIVASVLALLMFTCSILGNYYLNPTRNATIALLLLVPNFLGSALLTRIIVTPIKKLFENLQDQTASEATVIGKVGVVVSMQVDSTYGQVEVPTGGAPLLLNARVSPGHHALLRGASVIIFDASEDQSHYLVRALETPNAE